MHLFLKFERHTRWIRNEAIAFAEIITELEKSLGISIQSAEEEPSDIFDRFGVDAVLALPLGGEGGGWYTERDLRDGIPQMSVFLSWGSFLSICSNRICTDFLQFVIYTRVFVQNISIQKKI